MVRTHNVIVHRANALLAALNADDFARLERHMRVVPLAHQQVLADAGQELDDAYFPHSGAISLMAAMREGGYAEITTVGPEGVAGLEQMLGAAAMPSRVLVQVAGVGTRIPIRPLRAALEQSATFRALTHRYIRATFVQLGQSVACNGLHSVEQRFARWLLMAHDRAGQETFPLTQELLSRMLGVRRATVNAAIANLKEAGVVRYVRGQVTVADRPGLESAACECYKLIVRQYELILPAGTAPL